MRRIVSLAAIGLIGFSMVGCTHQCNSHDPYGAYCPPADCREPGLFDGLCKHFKGGHNHQGCCPPPQACPPPCSQPQCPPQSYRGQNYAPMNYPPHVQGDEFTPVPQVGGCDCQQQSAGYTDPQYAMSPEYSPQPTYPMEGQFMTAPDAEPCPHCGTNSTMLPPMPSGLPMPSGTPLPAPAVEGSESDPGPMPIPDPVTGDSAGILPPTSYWVPTAPARYSSVPPISAPFRQAAHEIDAF